MSESYFTKYKKEKSMDKSAVISYLEGSFIKDILLEKELTDISYNGREIFYATNLKGREKSKVEISQKIVKDFLRQIANMCEKQFNYLNPILDLNVGKYRLNAVNDSVGRDEEDGVVTFSLRIASSEPKILNDHRFMNKEIEDLLDCLIFNHISLVIAGVPGVGKTELQKYLISRINENERIIIIDQTIELSLLQSRLNHDITVWQAEEKNKEANVSNLIKNGLRNNPDWMIISEARGEEMNDILTSAMTGIPIITTIHSYDAFTAPNRMAKMIMLSERKMTYEDIMMNINEHFKIYIYLKKHIDKRGLIKRYISSIIEVDNEGLIHELYSDNLKSKKYAKISNNLSNLLINNKELIKRFDSMKGQKETK